MMEMNYNFVQELQQPGRNALSAERRPGVQHQEGKWRLRQPSSPDEIGQKDRSSNFHRRTSTAALNLKDDNFEKTAGRDKDKTGGGIEEQTGAGDDRDGSPEGTRGARPDDIQPQHLQRDQLRARQSLRDESPAGQPWRQSGRLYPSYR